MKYLLRCARRYVHRRRYLLVSADRGVGGAWRASNRARVLVRRVSGRHISNTGSVRHVYDWGVAFNVVTQVPRHLGGRLQGVAGDRQEGVPDLGRGSPRTPYNRRTRLVALKQAA